MEKFSFLTVTCLIYGTLAIKTYYLDDQCESVIDVKEQIRLTLTGSGYNYQPNFSCKVTTEVNLENQMMVYFQEYTGEQICFTFDQLEFVDGLSRYDHYVVGLNGNICEKSKPVGVYKTSGRHMTVYFQSGNAFHHSGVDMILTSFHTGSCSTSEHKCNNGRCISNNLRCNGYNPCGDNSDCYSLASTSTPAPCYGSYCDSLSGGAIVGISIGCTIGFVVIVVVIYCACTRKGVTEEQSTPISSSRDHPAPPFNYPGTTNAEGYDQRVPPVRSYAIPLPYYHLNTTSVEENDLHLPQMGSNRDTIIDVAADQPIPRGHPTPPSYYPGTANAEGYDQPLPRSYAIPLPYHLNTTSVEEDDLYLPQSVSAPSTLQGTSSVGGTDQYFPGHFGISPSPYVDNTTGRDDQTVPERFAASPSPHPDATEVMGAGIVKPQPDGGIQIHIHTSANQNIHTSGSTNTYTSTSSSSTQGQASTMSCEECAASFTPFKRKKSCKDCARHFCSQCISQPGRRPTSASSKDHQCRTCQILLTGKFTRTQLLTWKVKDLKALLNKQNINISKCKEKSDLIDVIVSNYGGTQNLFRRGTEQELLVQQMTERMRQEESNSPRQSASRSTDTRPLPQVPANPTPAPPPAQDLGTNRQNEQQDQEMGDCQDEEEDMEIEEEKETKGSQPFNPRIQLDDVKSEEEIDSLSVKSLKRLLLNNFVDYKGCREKWELQDRVKRLWRDNQANKKKFEEQIDVSKDPSTAPPGSQNPEDDMCKICMDAAIDCVLLECGHMVSCTKCGKQLSECPICRQYVIRAVHTFRS